jgi:hypothetical protein
MDIKEYAAAIGHDINLNVKNNLEASITQVLLAKLTGYEITET